MSGFDMLDQFIEECIQARAFSCAAAGVGVLDQTMHLCVKGSLSFYGEETADMETRFDLASLSKVFATTPLSLLAIEEGRMTLNDPLSMYFKTPQDKRDITTFQLLTHTAGFHPSFLLEERCASPSDALPLILSEPLAHAAGTAVDYSCMGFILLGKVLEKIYDKPLNVLAEEKVFSPLGMNTAGYLPQGDNFAGTECVLPDGSALSGVVHDENARFLEGVAGNAGVFSSLSDCMRFCSMLACKGTPLLSHRVLSLAVKDHTPQMGIHRGLGFYLPRPIQSFAGDLFTVGSFGHTGFTGTSILVEPQTGFYAVLLTNAVHPRRSQTDMLRLRARFHNIAYTVFSKGYHSKSCSRLS